MPKAKAISKWQHKHPFKTQQGLGYPVTLLLSLDISLSVCIQCGRGSNGSRRALMQAGSAKIQTEVSSDDRVMCRPREATEVISKVFLSILRL